LVPYREEPPDAPRFRHARHLDPLGVEPFCSLGSDLPIVPQPSSLRSGLPSATARGAFSFSVNSQEAFITAISSLVFRNLPARSPYRKYGGRLTRGNR